MDRQGLILTLGPRYTIILTKDHEYLKIRRPAPVMPVGQTIWFPPLIGSVRHPSGRDLK